MMQPSRHPDAARHRGHGRPVPRVRSHGGPPCSWRDLEGPQGAREGKWGGPRGQGERLCFGALLGMFLLKGGSYSLDKDFEIHISALRFLFVVTCLVSWIPAVTTRAGWMRLLYAGMGRWRAVAGHASLGRPACTPIPAPTGPPCGLQEVAGPPALATCLLPV